MGDQSEAMASIIWLYQTVDAQKEEVFFPDLLITLRKHDEPPAILSGTPLGVGVSPTQLWHG